MDGRTPRGLNHRIPVSVGSVHVYTPAGVEGLLGLGLCAVVLQLVLVVGEVGLQVIQGSGVHAQSRVVGSGGGVLGVEAGPASGPQPCPYLIDIDNP